MMTVQEHVPSCDKKEVVLSDRLACDKPCQSDDMSCGRGPRIALLTPYNGGNLGDAVIQDAIIANIRLRLPDARFSGISLNCDNFVERHGVGSFPIDPVSLLRGTARRKAVGQPGSEEGLADRSSHKRLNAALIKRTLKRVPVLGWCLKTIYGWGKEFRHCVAGYHFLCAQDLLIVSGGGQLCDRWGGPWHHPFALFKWAVLARMAKIPYVVASVGASTEASRTSRLFLSAALRMARYRSYRDKNSRDFAIGLVSRAAGDSVVPDAAFSLPSSKLPRPAGIRALAQGRTIVALSPIAYAKPGRWPHEDRALHNRYVQQMARVALQLLERGYFLVIVCSSLSDDESVIPEILGCLDQKSKKRFVQQMHIATITGWQDLMASLMDVDFLIASRLHSVILGFVSQRPTIAISFHPKVDWVMEDLGQTDYLLQIRDFTAQHVIETLDRLALRKNGVIEQIGSYQHRILSVLAAQYDALAQLATVSRRHRN
jgi:polysaccharide pyruvyl transferase WcaK-like protein